MEYFAFGETFVEEHRSSNNSPYKFNGKELDEETGWYYYGARYYDPRVSVWLSVDPLAEQTMTPYQYGYQNPIKYVDPDGRNPIVIIGGVAVTVYELAAITLLAAGTTYTGYMLSKDINGTISFHNPFGGGYGNPNDWTTSRGDQWIPKEFLKGTRGLPNINPGGGKKGFWTSIILALGGAGSLYLRNKDYTNYYIDKAKGLSAEFLSNEIQTENYNGYDIKFNIMKYHLKYEVKEGDNLSTISESFGISMEQIIELNNIKDPDKISKGSSLIIAEDYVIDADVQQNPASKKDNIRISNQESIKRQVMEKEIKQKERR